MVTFENRRPPRHEDGSVAYRLDVVAASAADVVSSIGGWLYDRARAGWDVHVLLAEHCDHRPLRILGMQAVELDPHIRRPAPTARPAAWRSAPRCLSATRGSSEKCSRPSTAG